jgi:hypothetical protein
MAKWYFHRSKRRDLSAGSITSKPLPCYGAVDFVAHVQVVCGGEELERARGQLLALVPQLVNAPAVCNGAVRFHNGMPRTVRNALRKAEKVIRLAEELLAVEDSVTECAECGKVTMIASQRSSCGCWKRESWSSKTFLTGLERDTEKAPVRRSSQRRKEWVQPPCLSPNLEKRAERMNGNLVTLSIWVAVGEDGHAECAPSVTTPTCDVTRTSAAAKCAA